jgi:iron complex transport system ATP-binding protein
MGELRADALSVRAGERTVVRDATFTLQRGALTVLLGPNGAGKTTLVRALAGLAKPAAGAALLDGAPVASIPPTVRARRIAYLPQSRPLAWPLRVRDVVALGRFAHGAAAERLSGADAQAVDTALADCALTDLADRTADTLSGGEAARMHLARALAAQAPILLADEPVAALDLRHQWEVMTLLQRFAQRGGAALAVVHDVALAARFADTLIWLHDGAVSAMGPPAQTLTTERLRAVYGMRAEVTGSEVRLLGPAN